MKVSGTSVLYALLALVTLGGALYTVIFLVGGSTAEVTTRVTVISGLLAPVIGVLILLLQQAHIQDQVQETKDKVNGHLEAHIGPTDDQIKALVDRRLGQLQLPQDPGGPPSPNPPTGGQT